MKTEDRDALRAHHRTRPFPHEGGCPRCREVSICNVCGGHLGDRWKSHGGCTNGRCHECHSEVCGDGGVDAPGHGFGRPEVAARVAAKRRST